MTTRTMVTSAAFWIVVGLIAVPTGAWYGPRIEEQMFPILRNQVVTITRSGNVLTFTVALDKNRQCRLQEAGYSVVMGPARSPINVMAEDASPLVTYPPGHFVLGPFRATLPPAFLNAERIEGTLYYSCHPFWQTRQIYGPIPVPPA